MIPEEDREDIIKFINQYYIRDPAPDEILTTEDVRICWGEQEGKSIGKYVLKKNIFFDVYVKNTHLHDVGNDLLISRADKICQRMKELLTDQKQVCMIDFSQEDDQGLFTKMVGYTRHRLVLSQKISF